MRPSIFALFFLKKAPLVGALTGLDDSNFHAAITAYMDDVDAATTIYGSIDGA